MEAPAKPRTTKPSAADTVPPTLTLFGPMQVLVGGLPLPPLRSRKSLWLLALLALRGGRPVEREWLAETLWPDSELEASLASLRVALSDLRRALGGEAVRLQSPSRHTLTLDIVGASVDVLAFDAAVASRKPSSLEQAVALYRGPLLEGCTEEWVGQEREARTQDCLRALLTLADAALAAGDHAAATGHYRRVIALDAWQEGARRGLMEALSESGDVNAAMQVYRDLTRLLREDPRAAPDEQTRVLYARLRAASREKAGRPAVPPPLAARESPAPAVVGHLPHPLTDLVGREDERLEVAARLRRSRLVTLTGPGGMGKTRLAIEIASEAAREGALCADGVWLVALETLAEGWQVGRQIASVFGLREDRGHSPLQGLAGHLRAKRLLLVLDNCEHLLRECATAAEHLLRECPGVRILATSREALGVTGESAWSVPGLAVPDLSHLPSGRTTLVQVLGGYESVQLFVERAQAVQQGFRLNPDNAPAVAQVCAGLMGLPLAIELSAARVRAMTVSQIAARLDDHLSLLTGGSRTAASRQQTLRATLDWSYDLLGESERALLGRLSVFGDGWNLAAAERVCAADDIDAQDILDLLSSLIDKSLVVFEGQEPLGRYRLLETVRQYAAERLAASGETARVRARHRDYFLVFAEEADRYHTGADQGAWLARLEAERANLLTALDWCEEADGAAAGLRLAGALRRFWETRGYYGEGRAYLARALARGAAVDQGHARAKALNVAGVLAYYQGDYVAAEAAHQESLALFREYNDGPGVAWALNDLGDVAGAQGDDGAARSLFTQSLALFRGLRDRQGIAKLLHHLGRLVRDEGDLEGAEALYSESLALLRELNDRQGTAWALHHIGHLTGRKGNLVLARSQQEEGLEIFRDIGNRQGAAWALQELGLLAVLQSDYASAQSLYEESLGTFRDLGNRQGIATTLERLGTVAAAQGALGEARVARAEALTVYRELGNEQGVARMLHQLGRGR